MIFKEKNTEDGFTLIEITIVIIIAGILLSLLASALLSYVKKSKIGTTEHRAEKIEEALEQYSSINRKYPCPASRVAGPDDANFGREVTTDCNTAAGVETGPGATTISNNGVRIGAVPTRSLSLPDEYAVDGWGNKFTYAVTEDLASSPRGTPLVRFFSADGGTIRVVDSNDNEIVQSPSNPNSRAHYVIVSHGSTGDGSYPVNSVTGPPVPCPASGVMENENCNDDNTFRATLTNSDVSGSAFFDDYVYYKGQTEAVLEGAVPANAVMPFTTTTCPNGWVPYSPAEGRFVIGLQDPTALTDHQLYQLFPQPGNPTNNADNAIDTGSTGSDSAILPPYVTLLFCRKT